MNRPVNRLGLLALQILVGLVGLAIWHVLTVYPILGAPKQIQFFFSTPVDVLKRTWTEMTNPEIWGHLWITLQETVLAFVTGALGGIAFGFLFARNALLAAVFDPYIKAANALPRVVLAPIFALWFGLGIWSKVALGFTLVFFIVFFNVYQGVREVSPVVLNNARMLGMSERGLLRHVYWPSALTWMFSSLHTAVGFALVGAVVGEYLGSSAGLGYKIHEAESVFDVTGVFAGMLILTVFVIVIDTIVTLIGGLQPRPPDAALLGFDLAATSRTHPDLAILHEDVNTGHNGRGAWYACRDPQTDIIYRVQTLAGDPLLQYTGIVDRPRPVDVGIADDTIIVVSGAPWKPEGLFSANQVVNTDQATWDTLLAEPFP